MTLYKRKGRRALVWVCVCVRVCFPCTKKQTTHFMMLTKNFYPRLDYMNTFCSCKCVNLKNKISPHHSTYIGISSQLKSKVPTILRTIVLTSLSSLLNLCSSGQLWCSNRFYYGSLVYTYILANLQLSPLLQNQLPEVVSVTLWTQVQDNDFSLQTH